MEKTTNYQLNQWEADDRVQRTDFNADNAKIDAALAGKADVASVEALKVALGNNLCFEVGSYIGTDTFGPTAPSTLTFPFKPLLVAISGDTGTACLVTGNEKTIVFLGVHFAWWVLSWRGNSLTWYAASSNHTSAGTYPLHAVCQMNELDKVYHYVAIGIRNN